jgi:hypothetical protein
MCIYISVRLLCIKCTVWMLEYVVKLVLFYIVDWGVCAAIWYSVSNIGL